MTCVLKKLGFTMLDVARIKSLQNQCEVFLEKFFFPSHSYAKFSVWSCRTEELLYDRVFLLSLYSIYKQA